MAKDVVKGILGDIRPERPSRPDTEGRGRESIVGDAHDEPMQGGSRHDESRHPGSRETTEGDRPRRNWFGGSRNNRRDADASSRDIDNRPE